MGHHRRRRSIQERRDRDRWYEAREQEREADGYDSDSSPEPEPVEDNPFIRMRLLLNRATAAKDPHGKIIIIAELLQLFLSKQYIMYSSGEDAYKKFAAMVQAKCAEFAAHPVAQNNPDFQQLAQHVIAAYR
jgi:hypothetical protein